jgi:chromosome segregation ATPase
VEDIRDTRPWFWILILAVLAVAAAGLAVAISAKNSSVDEKKVVDEATAQIKEELSGLNGALRTADEFQEESDKLAAQDRARIKRATAKAVAGTRKRLHKVNARLASLEGEVSAVQGETAKLKKSVAKLGGVQEAILEEVVTINRRVRNLSRSGGSGGA